MTKLRIAALFDAENIGCDIAGLVMGRLRQLGEVQSACAVGDFTVFKQWIDCGRDNGINLVMQPSLGKGKNSADICLTIEAMDLAHRGQVNAIALITHDRDFTPLAFRLREAGLTVMGFGRMAPSPAFRSACSSFEVMISELVALPIVSAPAAPSDLTARERASLANIAAKACANGNIQHSALIAAVKAVDADLAAKLKGKFLKTLVAQGIVERVGTGSAQLLRRCA